MILVASKPFRALINLAPRELQAHASFLCEKYVTLQCWGGRRKKNSARDRILLAWLNNRCACLCFYLFRTLEIDIIHCGYIANWTIGFSPLRVNLVNHGEFACKDWSREINSNHDIISELWKDETGILITLIYYRFPEQNIKNLPHLREFKTTKLFIANNKYQHWWKFINSSILWMQFVTIPLSYIFIIKVILQYRWYI